MEIAFDDFGDAEVVAAEREAKHPDDAARDIINGEAAVLHPADAGDEWCERPDDGNEPGQHNRPAAVLVVEMLRALQVLLVEEPGVFVLEDLGPEPVAD